MTNAKCKICRQLGVKLFLKGKRCETPQCAMIKKPYSPGQKGKKGRRGFSEYGKELKEKQKLRVWYNLGEREFSRYVKQTLSFRGKVENAVALLIMKLESRLDNVVFRLGFASSRAQARQMVSHGHFLINGKKVRVPSLEVEQRDKIYIHPSTRKKKIFQNLSVSLEKYQPPSWLKLDKRKLEGVVAGKPSLEEAAPPADVSVIFEYYSR